MEGIFKVLDMLGRTITDLQGQLEQERALTAALRVQLSSAPLVAPAPPPILPESAL